MGIVLVGVDQTVVKSCVPWWHWCNARLGLDTSPYPHHREIMEYNFSNLEEFKESLAPKGGWECTLNLESWWGYEGIYYNMSPIKGSVEALKALSDSGMEIVFVSQIVGDHYRSKLEFLERNFPFMSGLIATGEKQYVRGDYIIDDRNLVLDAIHDSVVKIRYETHFTQDSPPDWYGRCDTPCMISSNWEEIARFILAVEEMENGGKKI